MSCTEMDSVSMLKSVMLPDASTKTVDIVSVSGAEADPNCRSMLLIIDP